MASLLSPVSYDSKYTPSPRPAMQLQCPYITVPLPSTPIHALARGTDSFCRGVFNLCCYQELAELQEETSAIDVS